jgi:hypothetical protein
MFWLILFALSFVFAYLTRMFWSNCIGAEEGSDISGWLVMSFICLLISFISPSCVFMGTLTAEGKQRLAFEDVKKLQAVSMIYQDKAEMLTGEFVSYLANTYPDLERDIFSSISPEELTVYMVKYPEIKSSETLIALVGQINSLQTDYYDTQIEIEEALAKIRFRKVNPWIINLFISTPPDEVLDLSYSHKAVVAK